MIHGPVPSQYPPWAWALCHDSRQCMPWDEKLAAFPIVPHHAAASDQRPAVASLLVSKPGAHSTYGSPARTPCAAATDTPSALPSRFVSACIISPLRQAAFPETDAARASQHAPLLRLKVDCSILRSPSSHVPVLPREHFCYHLPIPLRNSHFRTPREKSIA